MFSKIKIAMLSLAAFSMLFVIGCEEDEPSAPGAELSQIRVIHTSYDAPNVDVQLDGENAITDLGYGQSSGYASVEAGTRSVTVTPTGETSPQVISENLPLEEGEVYSIFAVDSLSAISAIFTAEDKSAVQGEAKIRFVHASPDAPAVDIRTGSATGAAVFSDAAFKDISDYITVDPNDYMFVVTPSGVEEEVIAFNPVGLESGQVYTVVAHGTLDDTDSAPFAVRVFIDNGAGDQFVDLTAAPTTSNLRVIHTSYDAPNVDVALDGTVAISDLAYGMSSGYAEVDFGTRNVVVTPTGATTPEVINADIPLMRGMDYTVFAMDELANITAAVSDDDREPLSGEAKIRFVHASPDAPAVDIKVGTGSGTAVFSDAAFTDVAEYITVTPGAYSFVVTPTGTEIEVVAFEPVTVDAGMVYTVVAHGTLDDTDSYPFAVRVFVDNDAGAGFVDLAPATSSAMVIHASPDAPGVDLYIDETLINTGAALEYPDNAGYLSLTSGTRNIMVNATGTETTVIDAGVTFRQDSSYSIFAVNDLDNIEPLVVMDDLTAPASGNGHVRFLHLSPDAPAVDITLDDGTVVFADYSFKEYSMFTPLSAGDYDLQVWAAGTSNVVLDLDPITVSDGMIYTIFAKGFMGGAGEQALGAEIIVNN